VKRDQPRQGALNDPQMSMMARVITLISVAGRPERWVKVSCGHTLGPLLHPLAIGDAVHCHKAHI
jgi:hypothetical protein